MLIFLAKAIKSNRPSGDSKVAVLWPSFEGIVIIRLKKIAGLDRISMTGRKGGETDGDPGREKGMCPVRVHRFRQVHRGYLPSMQLDLLAM